MSATGPQARIDQLTGLRTLLAPARAARPDDFARAGRPAPSAADTCPFCPGREDRTPSEVAAERPPGGEPNGPGWLTRVVPNLYPALAEAPVGSEEATAENRPGPEPVDPLASSPRAGPPDLFASQPVHGAHEVIIGSPEHVTSLADLDLAQLERAIAMWRERMRANREVPYSHLIVNEGPTAGASLEHTHAQLYALPFVPTAVARERERFAAYHTQTQGGSLLADVCAEEVRLRERLVAVDEEALLICPWASRSPFEMRIVPRRPQPRFEDDGVGAAMIGRALELLGEQFGALPELNMWVRTAPRGSDRFHWHVDIAPRLAVKAGFELGTGVDINIYPPERAAADLRGD